jgi:hypothetical protein
MAQASKSILATGTTGQQPGCQRADIAALRKRRPESFEWNPTK